ncbi:MAG TPA: T9SS type A sorting domain-containing protein [Chitinophagales bacterium]|nr:T9SS type A sorting domain-containing protein [Chitinophagales bacterium]
MKNKILLLLFLFPVSLMAQQPHHSGYNDWLHNHPSLDHGQFNKCLAQSKLRDMTYFLSGTRRDTFDLPGAVFNVADSAQYLYNLDSDSSLNRYVKLIHDVDSGWINYLAYYYGYDAQYNNDTVMLSFWDNSNLVWLAQQLTVNTFDANNNVLSSTFYIWDSSYWKNASQVLYAYDTSFNLILQTQLSWNGVSWDELSKFAFSYDANNNRIGEIDSIGGAPVYKYITSYDSSNYETQNIQQTWNGSTWKNAWRDTLSYDANYNVVIYERRAWHSGSFSLTDTKYAYMFNGMNQLIERIDSNGDGASGYFPAYNYTYTYDVNNNMSYQLQQRYNPATVSFDNTEQIFYYYTTIISGLNFPDADEAFSCKLYPNPAQESLEIMMYAAHASNIDLQVLNVNGQIISNNQYTLKAGYNFLRMDVSELSSGIYCARILDGQTKTQSVNRFIKE